MLRFSANRISPFLRDVVITTLTSMITILSMIIVTRLLAKGLGPEEFGAYSLARRMVSTLLPFATLTMGVALARYVGLYRNIPDRFFYLWGASIIAVGFSLLIAIMGWVLQKPLAFWIFGKEGYAPLCNALFFMLVGTSLYAVLYAYYRGLGQMGRANLWQVGVMGVCPLVVAAVLASKGGTSLIVFLMGGLFMIAAVPLFYHLVLSWTYIRKGNELRKRLNDLFKYGWPRTPGGLAFAGILTIGPLLASHFGSLKDAGYLVVGQSLFRIVESGLTGFGLVALPKVAQLHAEGKESFLKERVTDLVALLIQIGLFIFLHLFLWSDLIVLAWLGKDYQEAIPIMRIIVLGLVPYLSYVMLRSIIDALEVKAVNTQNLILALMISLPLSIFLAKVGFGVKGIALGTTLGIVILGGTTLRYLWHRNQGLEEGLMFKRVLLLNILLFLPAWGVHAWLMKNEINGFTLLIALSIECLIVLIYLTMLKKWQARWMTEIEKRIVIKK
ncbi:lipopolysaccharide biosynthesis protein [bacterium]|nr:lipopolysaccharide biosynthesis protein [bacterium]MBU1615837.1 lipopolysaccharide biosynthesis protein [bacterium]